jgi:hypothetical protein
MVSDSVLAARRIEEKTRTPCGKLQRIRHPAPGHWQISLIFLSQASR